MTPFPSRPTRWRAALAGATLIAMAAGYGQPPPAQAGDLVPYAVVDGAIPRPLTDRAGDAARGRAIAAGRQGNCLACHNMPIPEQQFHGDLGPDLAGVGDRLSAGELRLRLVDSKQISDQSVMPSFYRIDGLTRVAPRYQGRPILEAQQIEDLIAYLETLREVAE